MFGGIFLDFIDLTADDLATHRTTALNYIHSTSNFKYDDVFYLVVYGVTQPPQASEGVLICTTQHKHNTLVFNINEVGGKTYCLRYTCVGAVDNIVNYLCDWFGVYIEDLRQRLAVTQIQQIHDEIIADSVLTYTVHFVASVYNGIRRLTDNSITIGISSDNVQPVLRLLETVQSSDKDATRLRDMYIGTFESCIHPIELAHMCNVVTQTLKLHTRQVYSNILAHVYPRRLSSLHEGTYLLQTQDYVAVVRLCKQKTPETCTAPDGTEFACQWVVAPIDFNCKRLSLTADVCVADVLQI